MTFASISKDDKSSLLSAAKVDFEKDLYKSLVQLGVDPDSYDLSTFEFDENGYLVDDDYQIKKHISALISRINKVNIKIAAL
jgi:hypothetical protein